MHSPWLGAPWPGWLMGGLQAITGCKCCVFTHVIHVQVLLIQCDRWLGEKVCQMQGQDAEQSTPQTFYVLFGWSRKAEGEIKQDTNLFVLNQPYHITSEQLKTCPLHHLWTTTGFWAWCQEKLLLYTQRNPIQFFFFFKQPTNLSSFSFSRWMGSTCLRPL